MPYDYELYSSVSKRPKPCESNCRYQANDCTTVNILTFKVKSSPFILSEYDDGQLLIRGINEKRISRYPSIKNI